MPVCPGRVNGFSLLLLEKPFTLPGYTGHRVLGARMSYYTDGFFKPDIRAICILYVIAEVYKRTNYIKFYLYSKLNLINFTRVESHLPSEPFPLAERQEKVRH